MKSILAIFLFLGLAGVALAGPPTFQTNTVNIVSGISTASNATAAATSGTPFPVPQGVPLTLQASVVAANTTASNATVGFNFSNDGVHYTTTLPLQITLALNNTTNVVGFTNVPASFLAGVQFIRADSFSTTALTNATLNAVYVGWWQ